MKKKSQNVFYVEVVHVIRNIFRNPAIVNSWMGLLLKYINFRED